MNADPREGQIPGFVLKGDPHTKYKFFFLLFMNIVSTEYLHDYTLSQIVRGPQK